MAKLFTELTSASLPEAYRSVDVNRIAKSKRWLYFAGPAFMVSVGYMDPGNWATDLAGGSQYGYALLWVILVSNLIAILLQTMCVRLGIVTGKDLAQACRDYYSKPTSLVLWFLCELAIIACDIAEVIGSAVAIQLLFGLPLWVGVLITGLDVIVLLGLMRYGIRKIEAVIMTMIATIFGCFALNLFWARPDAAAMANGLFVPTIPDAHALFIAVGILGATVMPHNLYLHSSLVQSRAFDQTDTGRAEAVKSSTVDTVVALGGAFFVNAGILVLAAAVFFKSGTVVDDLAQAHQLLTPALGGAAAILFAVALLCSGQSSTITATLAGQVVMEGFLKIHVEPWLRRLITRGLAIVPALLLVGGPAGGKTVELLTWTQVILSLQLPFAVIPLLMFTSSQAKMGRFKNPKWMVVAGIIAVSAIVLLNVKLVYDTTGIGLTAALILLAIGITVYEIWSRRQRALA
jgi:manganese transport protein